MTNLGVAQHGYGGDVKLKITYKGRPLVGYTITGSINDIDIGARGVTDSNGEVDLHTDPLPLPQFDVKGTKTCGSADYEWEVSGYVYLDNNNYCHLELERPIKMLSEMAGMDIGMIVQSYGLNCDGSLGGSAPSSESESGSESSGESAVSPSTSPSTSSSGGSTATVESKPEKTEEEIRAEKKAQEDAEWEKKKAEQKKKNEENMEYVQSGQMRADGLANQETALNNSLDRINRDLEVKRRQYDEGIANNTLDSKEKTMLELEIEGLELKKDLKELKLEKVHKEMEDYLTKTERQDFKSREKALEEKIDQNKENQKLAKKGNYKALEKQSNEGGGEADDKVSNERIDPILTEGEIADMSTVGLKTKRTKLATKKGQLNAKLKVKSGVMKQSKKEEVEGDIELIQQLIELIDMELEKREAEKEAKKTE